jgi:hypothetical protein
MLMNNLVEEEDILMIHLILARIPFHFLQMLNMHLNERNFLRDVIYFER